MANPEAQALFDLVMSPSAGEGLLAGYSDGRVNVFSDNLLAWSEDIVLDTIEKVGAEEIVMHEGHEYFPDWINEASNDRDAEEFNTRIDRDPRVPQPELKVF